MIFTSVTTTRTASLGTPSASAISSRRSLMYVSKSCGVNDKVHRVMLTIDFRADVIGDKRDGADDCWIDGNRDRDGNDVSLLDVFKDSCIDGEVEALLVGFRD